jgi:glycosyltransferase involved in cell wall biosynthesis
LNPNAESADLLRLITRLNIGGPARQALLLTRELRDAFPTVLAAGTSPSEEGELSDPAIEVVRLPLVRPVSPGNDARAFRQLRHLIGRLSPRLIHSHMAKAGALGRFAALSTIHRPRLVHTFHGHVLEGYFRPVVERTFARVERLLARRTDALIAVSDEIRDYLLGLGIGKRDQWHVIPLGFDLTAFLDVEQESRGALRAELGLAGDVKIVGVVGRLAPIKDLPTLFQAMQSVPNAHLVVAGGGELRQELEVMAVELGLGGRVHFIGWRTAVADLMRDLDVVALSSRNEGTPVSLIEALAAGRPVVATDVGGVRAVVQDGVSGYLTAPGDAAAMGKAISRLLADDSSRITMGLSGRQHVAKTFGKARLVSDISDLYNEVLSTASPKLSRE